MAVYVVLTAGGIGSRIGSEIPKQFLHVANKPIIVYTLEAFQRHPNVDGIVVSCLVGWDNVLAAYASELGITKLRSIVPGGATNHQSIYNALVSLGDVAAPDDLILVHDGNRALVSDEIISNSISVAERYGNAITCIPCTEVIARKDSDDAQTSSVTIPRESLVRTQTPHVFRYKDIMKLHEDARQDGIDSAAAPELLARYGQTIHLCPGDETNFKITTGGDLQIFKALIEARG